MPYATFFHFILPWGGLPGDAHKSVPVPADAYRSPLQPIYWRLRRLPQA